MRSQQRSSRTTKFYPPGTPRAVTSSSMPTVSSGWSSRSRSTNCPTPIAMWRRPPVRFTRDWSIAPATAACPSSDRERPWSRDCVTAVAPFALERSWSSPMPIRMRPAWFMPAFPMTSAAGRCYSCTPSCPRATLCCRRWMCCGNTAYPRAASSCPISSAHPLPLGP